MNRLEWVSSIYSLDRLKKTYSLDRLKVTFAVSLSTSDSRLEDEGGIERRQREASNASKEGRQTLAATRYTLAYRHCVR